MQESEYLSLTASQILQLEKQGCFCTEWRRVRIHPATDLRLLRSVRFRGDVRIGLLEGGEKPQGVFNALLESCSIGDHNYISNVQGELSSLRTGRRVHIENVGRIVCEPEAACGLNTPVSVLDEAGSRAVPLCSLLTSQLAALIARYPRLVKHHVLPLLHEVLEKEPVGAWLDDDVMVRDVTLMRNVRVGRGIAINGASRLEDGQITSTAPAAVQPMAYIGARVDAKQFVIVDGCVDSGALLRNCFVGQGAVVEKGFTAHDSLFFANCSVECGEACAVLAGPYTVSMHKSSLLIGAEYSFMNAGSGTNASNHMYKLGPVHWGIMERGTKTASGAYMMWNGKIGAYSLLMGQHKSHPDTSDFPFSYLFSTAEGKTIVAPGLMLRSCGLMRDKLKWPKRDRRIEGGVVMRDHIIFEPLNPMTVGRMVKALDTLEKIDRMPASEDGYISYEGLLFSPKSLQRGIELYSMAIARYLLRVMGNTETECLRACESLPYPADDEWIDLGGQIMPAGVIQQIKDAEDFNEIPALFDHYFDNYAAYERAWLQSIMTPRLAELLEQASELSSRLEALIEQDRIQAMGAASI